MASFKSDFSLSVPFDTDIWRKPPSTNAFNAPKRLNPPIPLSSFTRAQLTFSFTPVLKYDQAGLFLHLTNAFAPQDKWIKTGIEFYQDKPYISTVGTDRWSDWSIFPTSGGDGEAVEATVEVVRENGALWVYQLGLDCDGEIKERKPLREIAWVFDTEEGWEVHVGAYAARPAKAGDGELPVDDLLLAEFRELKVEKAE